MKVVNTLKAVVTWLKWTRWSAVLSQGGKSTTNSPAVIINEETLTQREWWMFRNNGRLLTSTHEYILFLFFFSSVSFSSVCSSLFPAPDPAEEEKKKKHLSVKKLHYTISSFQETQLQHTSYNSVRENAAHLKIGIWKSFMSRGNIWRGIKGRRRRHGNWTKFSPPTQSQCITNHQHCC